MAPMNFKSNYKTVSKKKKNFFCASADTLEFIVDVWQGGGEGGGSDVTF